MLRRWQESYLALFNGDSGAMAVHYGWTRSIMAWIHLVMRPFFATLSDSFGRRHLMSWGRLGTVAFFAFHRFRDRSPWHRMVMENVCWPPSNSCWPVFAAAHSDLFGSRPELSAQIQAADGFWMDPLKRHCLATCSSVPPLPTRRIHHEEDEAAVPHAGQGERRRQEWEERPIRAEHA